MLYERRLGRQQEMRGKRKAKNLLLFPTWNKP